MQPHLSPSNIFIRLSRFYKWKRHKLLVWLQQTSGLEKEGKTAKLTVMTFAYCSTWFFILWPKRRMSALCFPYQDHDFCSLFYLIFILWPKGRMSALCFPYQDQLTCLCDRVGRVLSCQSGQQKLYIVAGLNTLRECGKIHEMAWVKSPNFGGFSSSLLLAFLVSGRFCYFENIIISLH